MEEQRKSENALVPALRFEGFSDPWEQRKVGDYLVESRERGSSGDVAKKLTVKLWGKGVTEKAEISGSAHTQYYVRHAGQFIYSKLDFLNAAFGVIPDNLDEYESTADLPAFDVSNLDARFLLLKATQRSFYLRYGTIADGSRKAKRIHSEAFLAMPLFVPDYIEQTRIANLFARLDSLIALHQRKHEKLKTVKQSLLEKMFPKEGEDVPEIRFEGFTDPWEQRKFLELVERRSRFSNDPALPRVEYEDIVSGQGMLNKDVIEKHDKRGGIAFEPGDVLYGKLRPYLQNWLNPQFKGIALGDFWVLNPTDISSGFLFVLIRTPTFERVANESTGTKMPRADWQNVSNTEFSIPLRKEEQEAIGALFQKLDSLIALHQRERVEACL